MLKKKNEGEEKHKKKQLSSWDIQEEDIGKVKFTNVANECKSQEKHGKGIRTQGPKFKEPV